MDQVKKESCDLSKLKSHCAQLAEHFDSVMIFCTRHQPEDGGTVNCRYGSGDWFARYGHVSMWLKTEEANFGGMCQKMEET